MYLKLFDTSRICPLEVRFWPVLETLEKLKMETFIALETLSRQTFSKMRKLNLKYAEKGHRDGQCVAESQCPPSPSTPVPPENLPQPSCSLVSDMPGFNHMTVVLRAYDCARSAKSVMLASITISAIRWCALSWVCWKKSFQGDRYVIKWLQNMLFR